MTASAIVTPAAAAATNRARATSSARPPVTSPRPTTAGTRSSRLTTTRAPPRVQHDHGREDEADRRVGPFATEGAGAARPGGPGGDGGAAHVGVDDLGVEEGDEAGEPEHRDGHEAQVERVNAQTAVSIGTSGG